MRFAGDIGFVIILFILVFSLVSLLFNVVIPFSIIANRWLLTVLALGSLFFYIDRRFR